MSRLSLRHQMKHSFLLDENVDIHLASVLKNRGHSVSVCPKGITDDRLLSLAKRKKCVLVTNDKDLADPDLHPPVKSAGIIVFRIHPPSAENISEAFENLLDTSATLDFAEKTFIISRTGVEIIA